MTDGLRLGDKVVERPPKKLDLRGRLTCSPFATRSARCWRDVRSQKLRTFLTVFGIVWGTVSVSLLLAFGKGLQRQMIVNSSGLGDAHRASPGRA